MTVLTKASDMGKKPDILVTPLVVDPRYDYEQCNLPKERNDIFLVRGQCRLVIPCLALGMAVLLIASAVLGLVFYSEQMDTPRYRGYCSIPIEMPRNFQEQAYMLASRVPLRWSPEPDVTVFSTVDGDTLNNLLERFDINDNVERISVYNSGHNVEFIHDFNANITGIVDASRCFTMELDPEVVLNPSVFVFSIERDAAFDVMRVRSHLHAQLPPAPPAPPALRAYIGEMFAEHCATKPTYQLDRAGGVIRKRSVDEPAHEYLHFAGKHVQEISIDNLNELVQYEKSLSV